MVFFRILHIFGGIVWVGSVMFLALVIGPAVARAGKDGAPLMLNLFGHSALNRMAASAALLTTLAGLALYERVSDTFDADWMSSAPGIVLSIGAVAGLLAFGHGFALSKYGEQMQKMAQNILGAQGPLSDEQIASVQQIQRKLLVNSRISLGLLIIAVLGMSAARYL